MGKQYLPRAKSVALVCLSALLASCSVIASAQSPDKRVDLNRSIYGGPFPFSYEKMAGVLETIWFANDCGAISRWLAENPKSIPKAFDELHSEEVHRNVSAKSYAALLIGMAPKELITDAYLARLKKKEFMAEDKKTPSAEYAFMYARHGVELDINFKILLRIALSESPDRSPQLRNLQHPEVFAYLGCLGDTRTLKYLYEMMPKWDGHSAEIIESAIWNIICVHCLRNHNRSWTTPATNTTR